MKSVSRACRFSYGLLVKRNGYAADADSILVLSKRKGKK